MPVTNDDVAKVTDGSITSPKPVIKDAAAGLIPISPTIAVVPMVEMPVFARAVKLPATPRLTNDAAEAMIGRKKEAKRIVLTYLNNFIGTPNFRFGFTPGRFFYSTKFNVKPFGMQNPCVLKMVYLLCLCSLN